MTSEQVQSKLGAPRRKESGREWYEALSVEYSEAGRVQFVEVSDVPGVIARFDGIDLLSVPAEHAVACVARHDRFDRDDPELGYSYTFRGLQLALWRPTLPEDRQPEDDPEGRTFRTVAIASPGYFDDA